MNYNNYSEEDVKYQFITPSIENAGWDKTQIRFEYSFTDGQMMIRGMKAKRGARKRADYLLSYKPNLPLAIVEAKDQKHAIGDGMQQGINYAEILDIPFVYSSNGNGFLEHDMITGKERELHLNEFPSPEELWERMIHEKKISDKVEDIIRGPYHIDNGQKPKIPRYYQRIAINRTIEAIANGKNRILLVMATGTGKTFTAFQIAHRLWKYGNKKKILYLADRNILIDQTMAQDFKPFEKVMTKVQKHELDSSYEVFFALYQQLVTPDIDKQPYEDLDPEFFDLIFVDECHRGSAKADSEWREILEYFSSATQIGMTATPKETKQASNITYFGEPVYTYSLKQGIQDGFLAPYKVIRILTDIDANGYRPPKDKLDMHGNPVENRFYNTLDFDKNIIIDERTEIVASKITEYLKKTNRFDKTIVFCVDTNHAERMRQALVNANNDLVAENSKYVVRITGNDELGKSQLDYFIDSHEKYPVIATTSMLMSTGVDSKTTKLIVLDKNIRSMTEFKQIIGRGTRLREDLGKNFFTIMDFRNNTRKFADSAFDGEPVVILEDIPTKPIEFYAEPPVEPPKVVPRVNGVPVTVILEQNQCYDEHGKLKTENFIDFTRNNILKEYSTLGEFIKTWNSYDKKQAIIDELYQHEIFLDELRELSGDDEMDDFDLICHIAFDKKPLTRAERANNVKKRDYLNKYEGIARQVLEGLLDKYASNGISDLESIKILQNDPFRRIAGTKSILKEFGGQDNFLQEMHNLQKELYVN